MSDKAGDASTDRFLASLDFANISSAREAAHRAELERVSLGVIGLMDGLETLRQKLTVTGEPSLRAEAMLRQIVEDGFRVLREVGIEPIDALGKPVDVDTAEVLAVVADGGSGEPAEDVVTDVVERGYRWRDRLLRRSKVIVSRRSAGGAAS
jgi:molecular chaperone GrpE